MFSFRQEISLSQIIHTKDFYNQPLSRKRMPNKLALDIKEVLLLKPDEF